MLLRWQQVDSSGRHKLASARDGPLPATTIRIEFSSGYGCQRNSDLEDVKVQ